MFKSIHKMKVREDRGFTLVELLIVVAIIGILAAIAIPQFGAYRRRGYNASALSDLRNLRTTEEAMMADFQDYGASHTSATTYDNVGVVVGSATATATVILGSARTTTTAQTVSLSRGVSTIIDATENNGLNNLYLAKATHGSGDLVYGAESDVTSMWRSNCATAGTCTTGTTDLQKNPVDATSSGELNVATWTQM